MDDKTKFEIDVWADLFSSRCSANNAWHQLIRRARLFEQAGVPLDRILDALDISRSTYYRKVAEAEERSQENRAAAREEEAAQGLRTRRLFSDTKLIHFSTDYPITKAVCKLTQADAPTGDTFSRDYEAASCPACNDYTADWGTL